MLVVGFPAGAFQANCYLLAADSGQDCVIVDPGQDAEQGIDEALREYRLNPVGVLATHGHFDHVFAARNVADAHTIPVYIQPADRHLLADPLKGLGPQLASMFAGQVEMREPREVVELTDEKLQVAGFDLTVDHAPGHTPG
ncbi:MAG: MBL fold metallo-hydrolase, partial [Thermocrispum sp.]